MKLFLGLIVAAILAVTASIALQPGENGTLECAGDELTIERQTITSALYNCIVYTPTPTPTPTATPVPVAPYASAPLCATHNPLAYHGLWNEQQGCHYDHTHFSDPTAPEVIAIFGDHTDSTGTEISYPWQTFMGATPGYPTAPPDAHYENAMKHEGYKFDFYDFGSYGTCPEVPQNAQAAPNAWLIERHSRGDKADFLARIHSFYASVRLCIPGTNEVAYLYTGGWQDFGQRVSPYQGVVIPLADNPQPPYLSSRPPYNAHGCVNNTAICKVPGNTSWISWNQGDRIPGAGHKLLAFGFRGNDAIDSIDATNGLDNPNPQFVYLCDNADGSFNPIGCRFNNTANHTYSVIVQINADHDLLDGVDDDRVNYEGFTDRWGNIVQGCTESALDCVPVRIVNMPIGEHQANIVDYDLARFTPAHSDHALPDFDVCWLNGAQVDCDVAGAMDSGWVGANN